MRDILSAYRDWLVERTGQPGFGREKQLEAMDDVIFHPIVAGDENRAWYGKHLRDIWFEEYGQEFFSDEEFAFLKGLDATCLEVLLALADAIYEQCDTTAPYNPVGWFWQFVWELQIRPRTSVQKVREKLETFVMRLYEPSGFGGIFPLKNPSEDQKNVEIWYQMMEYLRENGY